MVFPSTPTLTGGHGTDDTYTGYVKQAIPVFLDILNNQSKALDLYRHQQYTCASEIFRTSKCQRMTNPWKLSHKHWQQPLLDFFDAWLVTGDVLLYLLWYLTYSLQEYDSILPYHQSPLEVAKKFYQAFNPKIQQELSRNLVLRLSTCYQPSSEPSQNLSFPGKWWDMPPAWFFMWTSTMKCQHQGGNHGVWFPYQCSMYGIFTNIYPLTDPNVGKHSIHGGYLLMYWRTKRLHCSSKDTPLPVLHLFLFLAAHLSLFMCELSGELWEVIGTQPRRVFQDRTTQYQKGHYHIINQAWLQIPKTGGLIAWSLILHHSKQLRGTQTIEFLGPKKSKQIGENKRAIAAVGGGAPSGCGQ